MRIACIGEGQTEYFCLPTIVGRRGHTVVGNLIVNGCSEDWELAISSKVIPRVFGMAEKQPDKILITLDRERRPRCSPLLAQSALQLIGDALTAKNMKCSVAIVVADLSFESILFADYSLVDRLAILRTPLSPRLGATLDGKNALAHIADCLLPGKSYDKVVHGRALAQKLRLDEAGVLNRSRSLRKLLKEIPGV